MISKRSNVGIVINVVVNMSSLRMYRISELVLTGNFPKELGERRPKSSSLTDMILDDATRHLLYGIGISTLVNGFRSSFRTFQ